MDYVWIGLGGALGTAARYMLGYACTSYWGNSFPYGTLIINVAGCFLLGLIQVLSLEATALPPRGRLFAGVGFCGGFTTFSTFTKESLTLLAANRSAAALLYIMASLILCLLSAWLGMATGRKVFNFLEARGAATGNGGDNE